MPSLFQELNSLMVKHGFKPNRRMGQNFIIEEKIIGRMLEAAHLHAGDTVLEIGAGTGFLTRELLKNAKVVAVELDETLCAVLSETLGQNPNFTLICGDFLNAQLPPFAKIVSLPPYAISSGLIYRLSELEFEFALLVFQREFANKLTAEPGFMEYGTISVAANYFFEPQIIIGNISPACFFPKPNSFSSLVKLTPKKRFGKARNEKMFLKFVKSVFRYKNKNLRNALDKAYPFFAKECKIGAEKFSALVDSLEHKDEKVCFLPVGSFVEISNKLFPK
ncbi:MAG: 16S rRNA (adenine(1518)-N(6)/adenine(1519)-N(6))-dimethyltransferase RsmA [Candidatus Diapherotrites archaeon]